MPKHSLNDACPMRANDSVNREYLSPHHLSCIAGALARVLPRLAQANDAAQEALLEHYSHSLDLRMLDEAPAGSAQQQVSST